MNCHRQDLGGRSSFMGCDERVHKLIAETCDGNQERHFLRTYSPNSAYSHSVILYPLFRRVLVVPTLQIPCYASCIRRLLLGSGRPA